MIITIDGPAGSGKSTVANLLSEKLGFIHFNSGALYRAVTAFLYANNIDIEHLENELLPDFHLDVKLIDDSQHVYVNNIDFTSELRKNHISTLVAFVGKNAFCRNKIDKCQKEFCSKNNIVIEGRDLGSFVFPNAELKFYLECSIKERARRRFLEVANTNPNITLEEIEKQIEHRDFLDKTRDIAPLVVPNNAIIIDSTNLSPDEVVDKMLSFYPKF